MDITERLRAVCETGCDPDLPFEAADEIDRLRRIIDSRPAINAGLPETYIEWSRGIYQCDVNQVIGHDA